MDGTSNTQIGKTHNYGPLGQPHINLHYTMYAMSHMCMHTVTEQSRIHLQTWNTKLSHRFNNARLPAVYAN